MRIAAVQLSYGDEEPFGARVERVAGLVAAQAGHDLVVLPELWAPTGFDYRRWEGEAQPLDGPWSAAMADAARAAGVTLHAGSFVERLPEPGPDGNTLANTSLVFGAEGERLAGYRKVHRFGFGSGEPKLMEAGEEVVVLDLPNGAGGTVRTGLSTCYDLRFPELYRRQQEAGAELLVVPAAWPLARVEHWRLLGRARAVENQCAVVQVNTAGTHADVPMGGHSQVVAATGEVVAEAAHTDEVVLSVELDLATTAEYRASFPVLADRRL
ncbi:carbon-nitrogen family hydrolase [Phycicoccus endophyticus]|uniref:Carbon-nitrogen family hydrolase n=1 Tax=Phycicoccus endophyticus TaxID=1690220 RepID=A0A7G9R1F3_9MICO|nr:carbon-nitrogen family hydrolase [Phycicoccus endophyticus]NHI18785.1 carbon-nitrogen family hydrolase [Phycicoccus endophyticus]QNN49428.1 carbon-nitrogen family hydrolase [Phycicoccus endophyticus]GGL36584.1 hydrolase [Phycicoccus endophyticus]